MEETEEPRYQMSPTLTLLTQTLPLRDPIWCDTRACMGLHTQYSLRNSLAM